MFDLYDSQRRRRRRWWKVEAILLLAGFLFLGWASWIWVEGQLFQLYDNYRLEQARKGEQPSIADFIQEKFGSHKPEAIPEAERPEPPGEAKEKDAPAPKQKRDRSEVLGRIEIPRVNVSAVVREGVDTKTLRRAVGHVPRTALPGETGNVGVAAHRDTFFRGVRNIRKGDEIRMVTPDGTYKYVVDSLQIVWPNRVEVLDPTPYPAITLVTCYPFDYIGSAPKRFIVQARQIHPAPESVQASSEKGKPASGS
jgi:sortase A